MNLFGNKPGNKQDNVQHAGHYHKINLIQGDTRLSTM